MVTVQTARDQMRRANTKHMEKTVQETGEHSCLIVCVFVFKKNKTKKGRKTVFICSKNNILCVKPVKKPCPIMKTKHF